MSWERGLPPAAPGTTWWLWGAFGAVSAVRMRLCRVGTDGRPYLCLPPEGPALAQDGRDVWHHAATVPDPVAIAQRRR